MRSINPSPVIKFIVERVPKAKGEDADWADILRELPDWWVEQGIDGEPPTPAQLGAVLRFISQTTGMRTRKRDDKVFFADRKVIPQRQPSTSTVRMTRSMNFGVTALTPRVC
jgi:hypothetical protein